MRERHAAAESATKSSFECFLFPFLTQTHSSSSNYGYFRATEFYDIAKIFMFRSQKQQRNSTNVLCKISTCDTRHLVGEVALLQILKMSRQPLPPRCQRAVVPCLPFALQHKMRNMQLEQE